jgi:hypothetical protein
MCIAQSMLQRSSMRVKAIYINPLSCPKLGGECAPIDDVRGSFNLLTADITCHVDFLQEQDGFALNPFLQH